VLTLFLQWLAVAPSFAVPYAFVALGLIVSERAGVLSLGAEGFMLVGALSAVAANLELGGHPLAALLIAMVVTGLSASLFGFLVVVLRVNQVITGLATVFFFQGLTDVVGSFWAWNNKAVPGLARLPVGPLADIPVLGPILFDQDILVYLAVPLFFGVNAMLSRSMLGLRWRAVGDSPETADATGISVPLYRMAAVMLGAAIIGLGGGYLTLVDTKLWATGITNGRGWIALALMIFARWRPWPALAGAFLFGGVEGLIPRIALAGLNISQYFTLMTPYVATLIALIWLGLSQQGRLGEPLALGQPFVREERR
jgi:simple sugar transport system permease protein